MRSTLLLRHLKVENANAISGLTYGFPAISHFLGFTHALSRRLEQEHGLTLGLRRHRSSHRATEPAARQSS